MSNNNKLKDLTGLKFDRLTVISYAGESKWNCICDCGKTKVSKGYSLKNNSANMCKECLKNKTIEDKLNDLSGMHFGKWVVIKYAGDKKWTCKCECGTESDIYSYNLLSGKSNSCTACSQLDKVQDIKGKKFGNWTVIEYLGDSYWKCKCSCGEIAKVIGGNLKNGSSTQCQKCSEESRLIDLKGKQFGDWTVLDYTGNLYWRCKCSCGNIRSIPGYNLRSGNSKSCGHDKLIDLAGQKINEWEVLGYSENQKWNCKCSCGNIRKISGYELRTGSAKSCGCKKAEYSKNILLDRYGEIAPIKIGDKRTKQQIEAVQSEHNLLRFIESLGKKQTTSQLATALGIGISATLNYVHKYSLDRHKLIQH